VLTTRGGAGSNSSPAGILISGTEINIGEGLVGASRPGGIFNDSTSTLARYSGSLLPNELQPEITTTKISATAVRQKEIIMLLLFRSIQFSLLYEVQYVCKWRNMSSISSAVCQFLSLAHPHTPSIAQ
jgi:hypothetical protein